MSKATIFLIFCVILLICLWKTPSWLDSDNPKKFWAGCLTFIVGALFMLLLNVVGLFNECSGHHNHVDYYDAPRK